MHIERLPLIRKTPPIGDGSAIALVMFRIVCKAVGGIFREVVMV